MSEYELEVGVPEPEERTQHNKYPIRRMQVGESFKVPMEKRGSISATATRIAKVTGKRFTVRKVDQDTVRVWRIE